ncbi:MAG: hypothetical protein D6798_12705 [Deltaproteobacteria bacterium]|nr:MAG: hypothetical protein D6798_12705 [Deltaproteobacteria bacterium]
MRTPLLRSLPAVAVVAAALVSLPATANPWQKFQAPPDAVEIDGAVELELLGNSLGNGAVPFVWSTYAEGTDDAPVDHHLMAVAPGQGVHVMSRSLAEGLGLKVKSHKISGQSFDHARVDQVWIGEGDARVRVEGLDFMVVDAPSWQLGNIELGADWALIDPVLLDLSWAILPSQGKVVLAPADQGAQLTARVGGSAVSYTRVSPGKVQYGKRKSWLADMPVVAKGSIGGQSVDVVPSFAGGSIVSNQVELPADAPTLQRGDQRQSWLDSTIGDVDLGPWWVGVTSDLRIVGPDLYDGGPVTLGSVGAWQLSRFDVAGDPVSSSLALAPASDQQRGDPRPTLLADKEAALDKCLNPEEPLSEEDAAVPAGKRCEGPYTEVAAARAASGDLDGALEVWQALVEADATSCANYKELGRVYLRRGEPGAAITALSRSSELFHAWWQYDAWDRADLQKKFDKTPEEEQDAFTPHPQPASCVDADALLASAYFARGDMDAVKKLYDDYLDMEPGLASVYGSALILADDVEAAHGPWRMVDHLSLDPSVVAKAGLGRLFAQQRDWRSADINYRRAMTLDLGDGTIATMWAEDMFAALGPSEALQQAREFAAAHPAALGPLVAVARLERLAGTPVASLVKRADPVFEEAVARLPHNPIVMADWARFLTDTGRTDRAAAVLDAALEDVPQSAALWLARAELAEVTGDTGAAGRAYARAVSAGALHPGYAIHQPEARTGALPQ